MAETSETNDLVTLKGLAKDWKTELLEQVIPFWMEYRFGVSAPKGVSTYARKPLIIISIHTSIDKKNGGYFTCLDGDGNLYDDTKFMWLNGRQVYMFAKMYCECGDYVDGATRESWIRDNSCMTFKFWVKGWFWGSYERVLNELFTA